MNKFLRLKAKITAYDDKHDDNHIFLHLVTEAGHPASDRSLTPGPITIPSKPQSQLARQVHYSAAVNVASNTTESRLAYVIKDYDQRIFEDLSAIPDGADGEGISFDYWANTQLKKEEFIKADTHFIPNNDFGNRLIHLTNRIMRQKDGFVVVFGKKWGPEQRKEYVFGFEPAQGLHDIHCNQSSPAGSRWQEKDAPGRDGAIFFADAERKCVVGVFTMFV